MNTFERLLAAVAPAAALNRVRARMALEQLRAYDAARPNRRIESYRRTGAGPVSEVGQSATQVRQLVRDLLRNNGYAQRAHRTLVSATIGTGITGAPVVANGKLANRAVRDAWERYVDNAHLHGDVDLYGLQMQIARAVYSDGEALLRRYSVQFDANEKNPPIRWQVLEADFIDTTKQQLLNADAGYIDRGIEYDAQGRKTALWLYRDHPGNMTPYLRNKYESTRVPLGEVVQVYDALRPGQDRGISIFSAAVLPLHDLAGYLEREAMRKSIEACLALFVTSPEDPNAGGLAIGAGGGAGAATQDALGNNLSRITPGLIHRLKPGESVEPGPVAQVGDMTPFIMQQQLLAAAGAGVMFEHMTGDFRNVNYSSYRVGSFDFARTIEQQQWLVFGHKMCRPLADGFIEGAGAIGVSGIAQAKLRWTPPSAVTSPDPLKDANADTVQLRNLTMAPSEVVERRGYNWPEMMERIAGDYAAADAALPPGTMGDADARKNPKAAPAAADQQEPPANV